MKTQTIEVDENTAAVLKERAAERGMSVPELVAELVTLAAGPTDAPADEIAELDRRWTAFRRQESVVTNQDVVRWLETWGTPAFRRWRNR
jgi:predicted transcriptional regulator